MSPKPHQPKKKDSRPRLASASNKAVDLSNKAVAPGGRSGKSARPKGPAAEGTVATPGGRSGKSARPKGPATSGPATESASTTTGRRAGRGAQSARTAKWNGTDKPARPKKNSGAAKETFSGRMTAAAGKKAAAAAEREAAKSAREACAVPRAPKVVKPAKAGRAQSSAIAAASPGSYLNNCRKRALSVRTRRELGQQPRDVLAQLAIAHPVKTMRLGAIRQLTNGDNARDVAALRLIERSVEVDPEIRAAASRAADIVQHKVDDL